MMRKILLAATIAASLGSIATPAAAAVDVYVEIAPPPLRVERVPSPRYGHEWVPGHWSWNGHRHVWVRGVWVAERRGYWYAHPRWEERDGRWYHSRGAWRRGDRDRDGVPNYRDRDRDGDGVPNRDDRRPDNPRRY